MKNMPIKKKTKMKNIGWKFEQVQPDSEFPTQYKDKGLQHTVLHYTATKDQIIALSSDNLNCKQTIDHHNGRQTLSHSNS